MFMDKKKFESYFSDRFTFSNICGRTSRRIYRLAIGAVELMRWEERQFGWEAAF